MKIKNRDSGSGIDELQCDKAEGQELERLERLLEHWLDEYDVEYPDESTMMKTIDALRQYVPVKTGKWNIWIGNLKTVMKRSIHEMVYLSPWFWIFNSILFFVCLVAVLANEQNPYLAMMVLAPLPTITGLIEFLKSKHSGMAELELSLKYSFQEIILSKMAVVGVYNFIVNAVSTGVVSAFVPDVRIWKLIVYWATPFAVATAIALVIASKIRHKYGITAGIVGWIGLGSFISVTELGDKIESVPLPIYMIVACAATLFAIVQTIRMYRKGAVYEFTD